MKRFDVLCDIDHVLAAAWWRDDMMGVTDTGQSNSWDDYHLASENDDPCYDMVTAINAFHKANMFVIGLTARPGKWYQLTANWLMQHKVEVDMLLMRPDDDYRPSPELKMALALEHYGSEDQIRERVAFVLDDRSDVTEAFHAIGLTTLQVSARREK